LNGQLDEAIEAYEEALRIVPNNGFILNNLAWLLIQSREGGMRDPQRALAYAVKAVDASKTPKAGFYDTLAAVLWILERHSEAVQIQERAVDLEPSNKGYQEKLQIYKKDSLPE
jgi:tetratricopeptide (TPR) repeat protein